MKRITIFIPTLRAGGAEKQAAVLASLLSNQYDVKVLVFHGESGVDAMNMEYLRQSSVDVLLLKGTPIAKIRQLSDNFKRTDVLFNYLTFCDFAGGILGRICGVKLIYTGIRSSGMPNWKVFLERIGALMASKVIFNSFFGQRMLGNRITNSNKQAVIPNCIPVISEYAPREMKSVKTIVTVARFVPQKDFGTAIKSIKLLSELRDDFTYVIIGYGALEDQIRKMISECGLDKFVKLLINPDNVPDHLRNADIYLSTSLFEGTSNSIMEAMDASLPVVATNVGDASYLVSDNNGFLVDVADCDAIVHALSALLDSYEKRIDFGRHSNAKIKEGFSPQCFLDNYSKLVLS